MVSPQSSIQSTQNFSKGHSVILQASHALTVDSRYLKPPFDNLTCAQRIDPIDRPVLLMRIVTPSIWLRVLDKA